MSVTSELLLRREGAGEDVIEPLPLVYIAGPYSSPEPVENTHRIITFANELLSDGLVIPVIPHLTMLWHAITPRPYEDWLAYDLHLLSRCDALYRVSGESKGADREISFATRNGLPVLFRKDDLYNFARAGLLKKGGSQPPRVTDLTRNYIERRTLRHDGRMWRRDENGGWVELKGVERWEY